MNHDAEIIVAIRRLIEKLEDRVLARCLLIAIASAPLRMRLHEAPAAPTDGFWSRQQEPNHHPGARRNGG
jgi:hypothetical protein